MQGSSSRVAHHIFNMHLNACKDGDLLGKICIYSRTMKLRKKKKLKQNIYDKQYAANHGESNLTCNSGSASDSKDATSTLYFPTLGHLRDSGLPMPLNNTV